MTREIGVPEQTVRNSEGKLEIDTGKPISPEQKELSRLRAENSRLRMDLEIVKNAAAGSMGRCNTT